MKPTDGMICLIPARKGSKRIPSKNTKLLAGHPLIVYTIAVAVESGVFDRVLVCSDDEDVAAVAGRFDVDYVCRETVPDDQPDVVWVTQAIQCLEKRPWSFCILRPTSPFRTVEMLKEAKAEFDSSCLSSDSLRAVEPCAQHPGKMWTWEGTSYPIKPLLPNKREDGTPWHSSPTQSLPTYWVQNSSLEMAWTANVEVHGTIAGRKVSPFFTEGYEGFSIDYERDWREAEYLIASGAAVLPEIPVAPLQEDPRAV